MADTDLVLVVAKLVDEMRRAGTPPPEHDLIQLAEQIAKGFKARKEEVAILRLNPDARQMLNFLFHIRLSWIGAIPLTTTRSLAAKTIRDKRGAIVNSFSTYQHPTVFEAVDLSEEEKAEPIQKIMSSPMMAEGKVVGVIEISRKAPLGESAGPDFTAADLAQLAEVGSLLGKYLVDFPDPLPSRPGNSTKAQNE